jgi:hypothetical protein
MSEENHMQRTIPMMAVQATASELIALGQVITHYIAYLEQQPDPTSAQLECVALLRSFQGRVVARIYPPKVGQR